MKLLNKRLITYENNKNLKLESKIKYKITILKVDTINKVDTDYTNKSCDSLIGIQS